MAHDSVVIILNESYAACW